MYSKDEISARLTTVLIELFEVDVAKITPEAHLYDDLEIDSIDAIDLVLKLEEMTGRKIQPDSFRSVRTVRDVVEAVYALTATEPSLTR